MNKLFFYSKAYLVCFAIIFLCNSSYGQKNLVPNYSFEAYDSCPAFGNPSVKNWFVNCQQNFYAYYCLNACSNIVGVPYANVKGLLNYQPAHTGQGYVISDYIDGIYERGYVETKLLDSLKSGHRYYVEFFVNLPNVMNWACNNSGALLTKNPVYGDTINFTCGFIFSGASVLGYGNPIITDTSNWTKIAGIYTALGGEQYITIGNFYNKANTKIVVANPNGKGECSYFIDDVSVIPLDSFKLKADADKDTTITLGDSAFIGSYTNGIDSLKWQLQNTGLAIDSTHPGFWVKPLVSTCYVLTQTVNGFTSSDTVCVTVGTVPLKFVKYEVQSTIDKKVENIWQTANEINVSHFNVQRSVNGRDFINVGKVVANNKNHNEYSFIDDKLPLLTTDQLTLYYRLQSVDKDGKVSYTQTRTLNLKPQTLNSFSLFPNPAKDVVNIVGDNIQQIIISTIEGKKILSSSLKKVSVKSLAKGVYIISFFTTNGNVKNEKLIIE